MNCDHTFGSTTVYNTARHQPPQQQEAMTNTYDLSSSSSTASSTRLQLLQRQTEETNKSLGLDDSMSLDSSFNNINNNNVRSNIKINSCVSPRRSPRQQLFRWERVSPLASKQRPRFDARSADDDDLTPAGKKQSSKTNNINKIKKSNKKEQQVLLNYKEDDSLQQQQQQVVQISLPFTADDDLLENDEDDNIDGNGSVESFVSKSANRSSSNLQYEFDDDDLLLSDDDDNDDEQSPRRRRVRFQLSPSVARSAPDSNNDNNNAALVIREEEYAAVWYTAKELSALAQEDRKMLQQVRRARKSAALQKKNENELNLQTQPEQQQQQEQNIDPLTSTASVVPLDQDMCVRGLEDVLSIRANLEARQRKAAVQQAVLDEQARQRAAIGGHHYQRHCLDDTSIRKQSRAASKASRDLALKLAFHDAREAATYLQAQEQQNRRQQRAQQQQQRRRCSSEDGALYSPRAGSRGRYNTTCSTVTSPSQRSVVLSNSRSVRRHASSDAATVTKKGSQLSTTTSLDGCSSPLPLFAPPVSLKQHETTSPSSRRPRRSRATPLSGDKLFNNNNKTIAGNNYPPCSSSSSSFPNNSTRLLSTVAALKPPFPTLFSAPLGVGTSATVTATATAMFRTNSSPLTPPPHRVHRNKLGASLRGILDVPSP